MLNDQRLLRVSYILHFLPREVKLKQAAIDALDDCFELIEDISDVYIVDELTKAGMQSGEFRLAVVPKVQKESKELCLF